MEEQRPAAGDRLQIGDEVLFPPTKSGGVEQAAVESGQRNDVETGIRGAMADIQIRVGTLLKSETVSLLLGAGASVECGGQLIGSVPLAIERSLQDEGISGTKPPLIREWLKVLYLALRRAGGGDSVPVDLDGVLARRANLATGTAEKGQPINVNFEHVLGLLHRWRSVLATGASRLHLDGAPPVDISAADIDECISRSTRALARACNLPAAGSEAGLSIFKTLLRKLLTRPLNLKRVSIFTLNYDTLVEQASDAEGVVLLDGFVGVHRRVFRPESYEQDLYFPAETTEGRVHRFDRVLHLYKLHGSITWMADEPTIDNPCGVRSEAFDPNGAQPLLVYPTPAKYGETLGMPYAEQFRRFAAALVRPQSVLFVIGYGFGDEHVNAIIRQALSVPSFTLVVVDPKPTSGFVAALRGQRDRRVWLVEGPRLGTLSGFVEQVVPDLRDEEVRKKVLATHRALEEGGLVGDVRNGS